MQLGAAARVCAAPCAPPLRWAALLLRTAKPFIHARRCLALLPPANPPAVQRRSAASFSGPGVLPVEVEAGRVEYKLRLAEPTPARFQQLVSGSSGAPRPC